MTVAPHTNITSKSQDVNAWIRAAASLQNWISTVLQANPEKPEYVGQIGIEKLK